MMMEDTDIFFPEEFLPQSLYLWRNPYLAIPPSFPTKISPEISSGQAESCFSSYSSLDPQRFPVSTSSELKQEVDEADVTSPTLRHLE